MVDFGWRSLKHLDKVKEQQVKQCMLDQQYSQYIAPKASY
jgi:hypothetical protein